MVSYTPLLHPQTHLTKLHGKKNLFSKLLKIKKENYIIENAVKLYFTHFRRQLPRLGTKIEIVGIIAVTLLTVGFNSCLFASVKFAPLGTVGCLYRTAVMVFCMVFSRLIMKENITIPKVGTN